MEPTASERASSIDEEIYLAPIIKNKTEIAGALTMKQQISLM